MRTLENSRRDPKPNISRSASKLKTGAGLQGLKDQRHRVVKKRSGYLLNNQAPHPETKNGQGNTDHTGQCAGYHTYLGHGLEIDLLGQEGALDQAEGIDHDGQ